jgi:hypothetical protein
LGLTGNAKWKNKIQKSYMKMGSIKGYYEDKVTETAPILDSLTINNTETQMKKQNDGSRG